MTNKELRDLAEEFIGAKDGRRSDALERLIYDVPYLNKFGFKILEILDVNLLKDIGDRDG